MQQMLITNLVVFSHVSTKMPKVCKFVASLAEARPTVVGSSQISFPPFFPFTDIPENAAKMNAKITRKIAKKWTRVSIELDLSSTVRQKSFLTQS